MYQLYSITVTSSTREAVAKIICILLSNVPLECQMLYGYKRVHAHASLSQQHLPMGDVLILPGLARQNSAVVIFILAHPFGPLWDEEQHQ
jgi:hypothetical protein